MAKTSGTGVDARGLPWRQVHVESIHETKAQVVDRYGAHIAVSTLYRRGGGPYPREGEVWIIDRTLGFWTFAAKVVAKPPVINGSTAGVPAIENLISKLAAADLVIDATDKTSTSDYNAGWLPALAPAGAFQYRKVVGGLVLLRGSGGSGSVGTLPSGYRPSVAMTFPGLGTAALQVVTVDGGSLSPSGSYGIWPVTVSTTGDVSTTGSGVHLDGITFLAEP